MVRKRGSYTLFRAPLAHQRLRQSRFGEYHLQQVVFYKASQRTAGWWLISEAETSQHCQAQKRRPWALPFEQPAWLEKRGEKWSYTKNCCAVESVSTCWMPLSRALFFFFPSPMSVTLDKKKFGRVHDADVWIWHFESKTVGISVISFGATLSSVRAVNKHGNKEHVSLGFDSLEPYLGEHPYIGTIHLIVVFLCLFLWSGSTVGRVSNRTAKGKFNLDGKEYNLAINNGPNHLHGGPKVQSIYYDYRIINSSL